MSLKAFESIPVIDTAQLLADLRPQTKVQIESLESCGDELFLGTYDGLILVYQLEEQQQPDGKTICVAKKIRERYLSTRKPIKSIKVASASERLLVSSNNCIFLLYLSSLEPLGAQLSGISTFCVNENPVDIDDPFAIQICVATKKKLEVHNAHEGRFSAVVDVAVSEPVTSVGIDGHFVCVALSSRYKIYNFKTKVVHELFDFPSERFIPIVRRIQQGEFLLTAPEGLGMFVTTDGLSNRAPIQWTSQAADFGLSGVTCTAYFHPYVLALCGNFIVVHSILDQQQKQSEHFSGGVSLGNFDGRIFMCSSTSVFRLCPVAWEKQVQALLADKKVDEALELTLNAGHSGSKEYFERTSQRIKRQAAFIYFSTQQFDKARQMFIDSNTDIREVISLFPNLLPHSSNFIRAIPPLHDIADVDQLFHRDAKVIQEARYCLHHFLEDTRELCNTQLQHQYELDTALVKLYAESNKDDLSAFILAGDVRCDTEDCLQWLERLGCFNAVALLHKQAKSFEVALDYWAKLAAGELHDDSFLGLEFFVECLANVKDVELVWRHAAFVLQRDQEVGVGIFTRRSKEHVSPDVDRVVQFLNKFPKALVNYLEYLVLEQKVQNEDYHSKLAVFYLDSISGLKKNGASPDEIVLMRKKFQRFLQESDLYRVQTVLSKIKGMGLDQETATLYGKIGEHDKALNILVHRLNDYEAAENYCEVNTRSAKGGDLFQSLLNCYLDPNLEEARRKELVAPALDLLNRRAKMFNMSRVLEVLPQELSVTVIESFLRGALRSSMHQYRMRKVESALAKGENIDRRSALHKLQKDTVFLQENNYCCVCKKPFLDGSFARYPNNVITHVNCAKQNDVCPLTGKVFRLPESSSR